MTKKNLIFAASIALLLMIFFVACEDNNGGGDDMYYSRRITARQAKDMMERYSPIVLDVRSEHEFASGHIYGAILLPDYDIKYRAGELLIDLDALILVYCRSGNRSRSATSLLVSMGYTNVYDFGGVNAWPYELVR